MDDCKHLLRKVSPNKIEGRLAAHFILKRRRAHQKSMLSANGSDCHIPATTTASAHVVCVGTKMAQPNGTIQARLLFARFDSFSDCRFDLIYGHNICKTCVLLKNNSRTTGLLADCKVLIGLERANKPYQRANKPYQ